CGSGDPDGEEELHGAPVVGLDVVNGKGSAQHRAGVLTTDRHRHELARAEPLGDSRSDDGDGVVGIHLAHVQHGTPDLYRSVVAHVGVGTSLTRGCAGRPGRVRGARAPLVHKSRVSLGPLPTSDTASSPSPYCVSRPAVRALACSCKERTPTSPRTRDSMAWTAAASPCTVVTLGTPRRMEAVRISYPSRRGPACPALPNGVLTIRSTSPEWMS